MTVVSFGEYGEVDKSWETGILSLYLSPDEVRINISNSLVTYTLLFAVGEVNINIGQSC